MAVDNYFIDNMVTDDVVVYRIFFFNRFALIKWLI